MSGHSKWSKVKHIKAVTDVKKGKIFSKLARMISVAAKEKGGDPETNPKLRLAIERAKEFNMPKENIERAIKRGLGKTEGITFEEFTYEAYGPNGIALIIEGITDNKNRTLSEIKHILTNYGGKLAEAGSVKYLFEKKNNEWLPKYPIQITDEKTKQQLDKLFEALDENDDVNEIYSNLNDQ
jgi:YebC/PmpR family DNA-binding regulatory protein